MQSCIHVAPMWFPPRSLFIYVRAGRSLSTCCVTVNDPPSTEMDRERHAKHRCKPLWFWTQPTSRQGLVKAAFSNTDVLIPARTKSLERAREMQLLASITQRSLRYHLESTERRDIGSMYFSTVALVHAAYMISLLSSAPSHLLLETMDALLQ